MKQLVGHDIGSLSFNAAARTLSFSGFPNLALEQLLTIVNVTHGVIIYCFADPSLGGVLVDGVLTLDFDTSGMSDADEIQAYIDIPNVEQRVDPNAYMRMLLSVIRSPCWLDKTSNALRAAITALPTLSTVTTVTTVSSLAAMGSYNSDSYMRMASVNSWANNVRGRIS